MNKTTSSWITKTANGLVLASSMIATEANAQENVQVAPEQPPITEEYRSMIIELLRQVRVDDDTKRLEGLRALEKALEEQPLCQMMLDTKQEILATLQLQKLQQQLYSPSENEVWHAADEIVDTWLKHDNFYIRRQAKRILDEKYKENSKQDPRLIPPDISKYTEPLITIKPVSKLSDLIKTKEVLELLQTIEEAVQKLDDESWNTRNEATRELTYALMSLREFMNPLPPEVLDRITPKHNGQDWHPNWTSLAKRSHADRIRNNANNVEYVASALPPMDSTVGQVIIDMEQHFHMRITLKNDTSNNMLQLPIHFTFGQNDYSSILTQICNITHTYPVCNGHPHNIVLVPIDDAKEPVEVISLEDAILVATKGANKHDRLQLFMDPQLALLSIEECQGVNLPPETASITSTPDGEVTWQVEHSGWKKPKKLQEVSLEQRESTESHISVTGWLASDPYTQHYRIGKTGIIHDNGPHEYGMMAHQSEDGNEWNIQFNIHIYGSLDWSQTPHESDTKTYGAAEATNIVFYRKDGSVIRANRGPMHIDQRRGQIPFTLSEKPHRAAVTTLRKIQKVQLDLPIHGEGATFTVKEESFKVN